MYVFTICLQLADAAKLSIHDKAFDWSKVELGLVLNEEPITLSVAEAAITALLYAPGAATETNALALCEKGIFGLQNKVELKLKAEQAAAEGADAKTTTTPVEHDPTMHEQACPLPPVQMAHPYTQRRPQEHTAVGVGCHV